MSRNLAIPPNFVTLRHLKELKEKREEEERLKKEEEERLQKLKEEEEERLKKEEEERLQKLKEEEEEQERLRELQEEEDRLRKLMEEEDSRKNPSAKTLKSKTPYRRKGREWVSRRGVNPDARPSKGGANGGSGDRGSSSGANLEAETALGNGRSAVEASTIEELKKKKKKRKKKNWAKKKENEAEMPLGLNGSDEGRKGFGTPADANGFEKVKKSTNVTLKSNGSDKKISGGVSYRSVKVVGYGSGPMVADIEKRVSDLKLGGRNPYPSRRKGPYWASSSGRGGGSGSVLMWVKKTTTEA